MKRASLALIVFLGAAPLMASVSVTGASGTFSTKSTFTITGAGFGSKSPAPPYLWAPFDTSAAADVRGQFDFRSYNKMAWSSSGGFSGGGLANTDGNGNWTAGVRFANLNADGQKAYWYRREKKNFLITSTTQNWKTWRAWVPSSAPTNYPNIYTSASSHLCNVEDGTATGFTGNFNTSSTAWVEEQFVFQASDFDVKNGSLSYYNGNTLKASGAIKTRYASRPDFITDIYLVHGVLANVGSWSPAWSTGNTYQVDDVYFDTTWSRVMIGDASTLAACTKLQPQIPETWTGTSILVSGNFAGYSNGNTAYLYVYDSNGLVNSSGYAITVAASVGGPAAPVLTGITPSSGPFQGGTNVAATGTDFSATVTVNVGTSAATNVVRVSSTRVTFDTPAAAPGAVAGVTLFNDDLQSSTIASTFTYAVIPAPVLTGITPSSGAFQGGTSVTASGTDFSTTVTVKVGTSSATNVVRVSSTRVTFNTPAAAPAAVADVTLYNDDLQSSTIASTFTYASALNLTGIAPSSGPFQGGTTVTATGVAFAGVTPTVLVGTSAATVVIIVSSTRLTFVTPAASTGAVASVRVTLADGQTSIISSTFTYALFPTPTFTSIDVSSGVFTGGTANVAHGTGFIGPVTVLVGSNLATGVTLVNSTTINFTVPAGPTGTTQIVRVTIGDAQFVDLTNAYTYFTTPVVAGAAYPPWR